ncbi:MAG: MFS transporter [Clostridia bacterium]|nr:MFS transporter [Clostridia bacterium]
MTLQNYNRTRLACYTAYFTMSSVFSLPPLLFLTLREMYGISYTLLGTLVLTNFCTQLAIDLIFTFFSKHFNIKKVVRTMPLITSLGLAVYALIPTLFPDLAYLGLITGTVIFSLSAGLSEVLLSPMIAAMPSDNPQKDMSMLHSLYAFGFFTVVAISTLYLKIFGAHNWMYLTLFFAVLPVISAVMFAISPMPEMDNDAGKAGADGAKRRTLGLAMFVGCIFFGSCSENVMTNWISGYIEVALGIDKSVGDILGLATFAVLLGLTRTAYARFGKNIGKMLLFGMTGAAVCYLVAGLAPGVIPAFIACILTGVCTAMLWPGTLIMMEENIPDASVAAFALMAAGGDFGASVAPQLMGIVIDNVAASDLAAQLSTQLSISPEQIGLKAGMLLTSVFPILGAVVVILIGRYFKKVKAK